MDGFANQAVLVTGASRGIGRATACAFARKGAQIVVNYRTDEAGACETAALIEAEGGKAVLAKADISTASEIEALVAWIENSIGPIAVLVNNAAAFSRTSFLDISLEELDVVLATNVRGLFYLSHLVAKRMAERRAGSIIHVTSILAQQTIPCRTAYATSKGAVESLTKAMALDLAPYDIRVNAVAPGLIRTEALLAGLPSEEFADRLKRYIPSQRFGDPAEIAEVILFLASPAAHYVNGALIPVDAGLRVVEAGPR